jgi:hypothetical protein
LKRRKERFAKIINIGRIDVVLERKKKYKLLREQKYKLLRELK